MNEVKELERALIQYLQTRPSGWTWVFGSEKLDAGETLRRIKNDKKFRMWVLKNLVLLAADMLRVSEDAT